MENQNEALLEACNQLLKGTHMGASVFEDLQTKLSSHELHKAFKEFLRVLKHHEEMLTLYIEKRSGEPVDTAGIMGSIVDFMEMVKHVMIVTDIDVIEEATKAIEMAVKAVKDFDDKHLSTDAELKKMIKIIQDDYSSIYHTLHKFSLEYK